METRPVASDFPNTVPRITLDFKYDYMGRRIRKTVTTGSTVTYDRMYMWNGWRLIQELDAAQVFVKGYHWGLDVSHSLEGAGTVGGLCAVIDTSNVGTTWDSWISYPAYDRVIPPRRRKTRLRGNGNVTGLVGFQTGLMLAKYEYDAVGRLIRQSQWPDASISGTIAQNNTFTFSTKFLDRETGLSYYGYRYYSAEKGRWVNRDPIAEQGGISLYRFCKNNPVNMLDILGKWCCDLCNPEKKFPRISNYIVKLRPYMYRSNPGTLEAGYTVLDRAGSVDRIKFIGELAAAIAQPEGILPAVLLTIADNVIEDATRDSFDDDLKKALSQLDAGLITRNGVQIWVKLEWKKCKKVKCFFGLTRRFDWVKHEGWNPSKSSSSSREEFGGFNADDTIGIEDAIPESIAEAVNNLIK